MPEKQRKNGCVQECQTITEGYRRSHRLTNILELINHLYLPYLEFALERKPSSFQKNHASFASKRYSPLIKFNCILIGSASSSISSKAPLNSTKLCLPFQFHICSQERCLKDNKLFYGLHWKGQQLVAPMQSSFMLCRSFLEGGSKLCAGFLYSPMQ